MLDFSPFISGGIGFVTAVLVGWLTGAWGNLRQIERLIAMIDKTTDSRARTVLEEDLAQRLRRHANRTPRGVKIGFLVFWGLISLFVLTGMAVSPPDVDKNVFPVFFELVADTMRDRGVSRLAATLAVISLYVIVELLMLLWSVLAFVSARSLYRRSWWRRPSDEPEPLTQPRIKSALFAAAQALFVIGFLYIFGLVYLFGISASPLHS